MTGELIDEATVETDAGEYQLALRFTEYEVPPHRDTHGLAVHRYSVRIENPDGDAESFPFWGSEHDARENEHNVGVIDAVEMTARDALAFYEEADGITDDLDQPLTVEAIKGDFADMVDNLAKEWSLEQPSEAVRVLGSIMETAKKLRGLGLGYHPLRDFYTAVREDLEAE